MRLFMYNNMESYRVLKKTSANGMLTLYLEKRDLVLDKSGSGAVLRGVVVGDFEYMKTHSIFGELLFIFRYGREDEEVMGISFNNIITLQSIQIHPAKNKSELSTELTYSRIQRKLTEELSNSGVAYPFSFHVSASVPPSVALFPAKNYRGAALGASYEIHLYAGNHKGNQVQKKSSVRMVVRLLQHDIVSRGLLPQASTSKQFLFSGGYVHLDVRLKKDVFKQKEPVEFSVLIVNNCTKSVRKIKAEIIQCVNVNLFKSGVFKSVVAKEQKHITTPYTSECTFHNEFSMVTKIDSFKSWLALDVARQRESELSCSVLETCNEWKNFSVEVSYYVVVTVQMSGLGARLKLQVPFMCARESSVTQSDACDSADQSSDELNPPRQQTIEELSAGQQNESNSKHVLTCPAASEKQCKKSECASLSRRQQETVSRNRSTDNTAPTMLGQLPHTACSAQLLQLRSFSAKISDV